MSRFHYYERLKRAAREIRGDYGFDSPKVTKTDLRKIYKDEGIRIDLAPTKRCNFRLGKIKGAYFSDDGCGATVVLNKLLPDAPRIFTMAHELKHHFFDRDSDDRAVCFDDSDAKIEIGAEVFAAELLFPDGEFVELAAQLGLSGPMCAEDIVTLKAETKATMSYQALVKKAEWVGLANKGEIAGVRWSSVEDSVYGVNPWRARAQMKRFLDGLPS